MAEIKVLLTEPEDLKALNPKDYVAPPDWLVRMLSTNQAKRCKRYPLGWVRVNSYPGMADDYDHPWGFAGESDRYQERWQRLRQLDDERNDRVVVKGNLPEEQYRFWNGAHSQVSEIATCRWCRHWAYGPAQMRLHQSKTDHCRILREIYDCARRMKLTRCFACGTSTRKEHWGIPLCATNRCLNKWRVGDISSVSQTLLTYAKYAFTKGYLKEWLNEDRSEKHNTELAPKKFNWDNASAY